MPWQKSNDVTPHREESSMLKFNSCKPTCLIYHVCTWYENVWDKVAKSLDVLFGEGAQWSEYLKYIDNHLKNLIQYKL